MKKLNAIFKIIDKENIILEETNLNHTYLKGIYFKVPEIPPTIGVKRSIVSYSFIYISVLAEELGHHFTTSGNLLDDCNNYIEELQKNKKEKKAKLWAADYLISDSEFVQALYDCISTPYDMCEHFNVTDEILRYKITSILRDEVKYNNIKMNLKLRDIPYHCCTI